MRELLLDAIIGAGVPWAMREHVCVEFCGNQWNEDWRWRRKDLEALPTPFLLEMYEGIKQLQKSGK